MKKIRDATQIIGMLERGDLAQSLTEEIEIALKKAQDAASERKKATSTVTLTLKFTVEGSAVEIDAEVKAKHPKIPRGRSFYFVTSDGAISTEHPQQSSMFDGPTPVRNAS